MSSPSLDLFWSPQREDNFVTATAAGRQAARDSGYVYVRREAFLFPSSSPGTVPLKLYYNSDRGDNFTSATSEGEQSAIAAGYQFVRVEGYVKPNPGNNLIPLKQYWNSVRQDNFLTGSVAGGQQAIAAGYEFVRIEGYGAFIPPVKTEQQRSEVGRVIPADGVMDTTVNVTSDGAIEAVTETINYAVLWGYRGGVAIFFSDANENTIQNVSFTRTFGVDGTAFGRSRRTDPWMESVSPEIVSRIERIHIFHFAPDNFAADFARFTGIIGQGVASASNVISLVNQIKGLGAKGA